MSVTIPEILATTRRSGIGRRRRLDRDRQRRGRLQRGRAVALSQARRRDRGRDREDRRAPQPGRLAGRTPTASRHRRASFVSWPRDDAKLERVQALMAEEELDALVVRAPDNVLYLTNFWGMKGYDAAVVPARGRPVLITIEPSAADAARNAWTHDVGSCPGTTRRPASAARAHARAPRGRPPRRSEIGPRALAGHPGLGPDGGRADDLHEGLVRRLPAGRRRRAAPRARARDQDGAGDPADAAGQRDRGGRDGACGRGAGAWDEGERGGRALGGLRPRRGHRLEGAGRAGARLLARLVGARDPHVHGNGPQAGAGDRADVVRDLGLRGRLLVRPHEERLPRDARPAL